MSKILAIFGATGQQGSSVVNHVLADPVLSKTYSIRAITRDTTSPSAQSLTNRGVNVVQADVTDRASLESALSGVHTIFAMTTPSFAPNGYEIELNAGKLIADVAVAKGVDYIIFSTLPSISKISNGKYTKAAHFDAKAAAEEYIRSLPIKSAFYMPGFFMENFDGKALVPYPKAGGDGYVISLPTSGKTRLPLIDTIGDGGKFVGAILAEPDKYQGKRFLAANGLWDLEEIAAAMTKTSGKKVVYEEVSVEDFKKTIPFGADVFVETFKALEEYGYSGSDTEEDVAWAVANARGRLSSLEEFLVAHPLKLE
jgi:uncharacterized protein YbjT (DUF2867 family)